MSGDPTAWARLAAAMAAAGDVVYEWDVLTDRIQWFGDLAALLGEAGGLAPETTRELAARVHDDDRRSRREAIDQHFHAGHILDVEYRLRQADGGFCWIHDRGRAEFGPTGKPLRVRGILRLVNRRKDFHASLGQRANFDELTGHFNRQRLREALHHSVVEAQRYGEPGGFLAVSLEGLDEVRRADGMSAVSNLLLGTGRLVERNVRAADVVGRLGRASFGIVLGRCAPDDLASVGRKIVEAFRIEAPDLAMGHRVHVVVGAVDFPGTVQTAMDAMTRAEGAMITARSSGGFHRYVLSPDQMREQEAMIAIAAQVKQAVRDGRVCFAFQPIVDATGSSVRFYECLLRLRDTQGDIIPAGYFIPAVERLGLTSLIDCRTLEMVVQELDANSDLKLAVNISALTVSDRAWLRTLNALLSDRPDLAERLIVEITETAAIHDLEESAGFVETLRRVGCKVALDDFGAGYTSFRHLKSLAVDIVKIDGAFVRDLVHSQENQMFLRTLLGLAGGFGLETIAECVETKEEADLCRRLGVSMLQGYYFGRPSLERPWPSPRKQIARDPKAIAFVSAASD